VNEVMTKGSITMLPDNMAIDALNTMQNKRINSLFIVNSEHQPIGALNMFMLLNAGVM